MRNLLRADIGRAQKKMSFLACIGIVCVLIIGMTLLAFIFPTSASDLEALGSSETGRGYAFLDNFGIVSVFIPFLVGIPVYQAVFTDDFNSRTMQTAIGRGVSRQKLILGRFIEVLVLLLEAFIVFTVFALICGLVAGATSSGMIRLIVGMWLDAILVVGNLALAMLILYCTKSPTAGLVFFILFSTNVFKMLLSLLDGISFLKDNNISISACTPSGIHGKMVDYALGAKPSLSQIMEYADNPAKLLDFTTETNIVKAILFGILFIGVYIILPLILSQAVFRKKELDF